MNTKYELDYKKELKSLNYTQEDINGALYERLPIFMNYKSIKECKKHDLKYFEDNIKLKKEEIKKLKEDYQKAKKEIKKEKCACMMHIVEEKESSTLEFRYFECLPKDIQSLILLQLDQQKYFYIAKVSKSFKILIDNTFDFTIFQCRPLFRAIAMRSHDDSYYLLKALIRDKEKIKINAFNLVQAALYKENYLVLNYLFENNLITHINTRSGRGLQKSLDNNFNDNKISKEEMIKIFQYKPYTEIYNLTMGKFHTWLDSINIEYLKEYLILSSIQTNENLFLNDKFNWKQYKGNIIVLLSNYFICNQDFDDLKNLDIIKTKNEGKLLTNILRFILRQNRNEYHQYGVHKNIIKFISIITSLKGTFDFSKFNFELITREFKYDKFKSGIHFLQSILSALKNNIIINKDEINRILSSLHPIKDSENESKEFKKFKKLLENYTS